ncbi:MAG: Ig-like domain-containing protein [Elusimicrobiota bacterium]
MLNLKKVCSILIIIGTILSNVVITLAEERPHIFTTVYTPNGTTVNAIIFTDKDFDSSEIEYWRNYVAIRYPNATIISDANNKYNCHSYAWYSQSTSNKIWINSPEQQKYWQDGSYSKIATAIGIPSGVPNDVRVTYDGDDHSAIKYSDTHFISKWGQLPVVLHEPYDCPDEYLIGGNQLSYYYRDIIPPTVKIVSPSDGAILNTKLVSISGTASDNTKVEKIHLSAVDGVSQAAFCSITAGANINWQHTFELSDGNWTITAKAIDVAGNESEPSQISFTIDTTPPEIEISGVEDGKIYNHDVTVTVNASDTMDSAPEIVGTISGIKTASKTFGEGKHTVTEQAVDWVGHRSEQKTVNFTIDKTPPEINPFPEPGSLAGSSYEYIFRMVGKQCCWSYSISKIPKWISFGATVTDKLSGVDEGSVTGRGPESQPTTITSVTCKGGSRSFSFSNPTERMRNMDGYIGGGAYLHGEQSYTVTVSAKDKAENPSSKTWSFNVGLKKYEQSKPNPDCDKPDDFEGVSCEALLGSSTTQICLYGDPIGITASGLLAENILLLADIGERFELVDYNFNLSEILPRIKVLIIPSGGLYGLGDVESFKRNLADYVNNGGTIVCFTQQHGYEFSALPATSDKQQVTGYGWNEDQSCQSASVYINEVSPIFNGQTNTTLDVNVDGYFTNWPADAKVLLRRTKNNMPCMIEYEIRSQTQEARKGRVIVTTLYSDFSYAQGSLSQEEKTLVKSLIDYAIDPSTPATQQLRAIPYTGVNFTLNTPEQTLVQGQRSVVYANVFNETAEQKTVVVKMALGWGLAGSKSEWLYYPTDSDYVVVDTLTVVGNSSVAVPYEVVASTIAHGWRVYGRCYEIATTASGLAMTTLIAQSDIGGWVEPTKVTAEIRTEKKEYTRNEIVDMRYELKNTQATEITGIVTVKVISPENVLLQQTTKAVSISPIGLITQTETYQLSATPSKGIYTIFFELEKDGTRLAQSVAYFEIPESQITLILTEEPQIYTDMNSITYTIKHIKGIDPAEGTLCIELISPEQTCLFNTTQPFNADVGQSVYRTFVLQIPSLKFGDYKLQATASYDGKTVKSVNILPCSVTVTAEFDKTFYRIRDKINSAIEISAIGKWELKDLKIITEIPSLSFMREEIATVSPRSGTTFFYTIPIPETLPSGTYSVNIKAILPDEQGNYTQFPNFLISRSRSFTVPPADLEIVGLNKTGTEGQRDGVYYAGETGFIRVQNTGGVDENRKHNQLKLSWRKSENTVASSVRLVRKAGNPPKAPTDGEIVYEGTEDNFSDENIQENTVYFYKVFQTTETIKKVSRE